MKGLNQQTQATPAGRVSQQAIEVIRLYDYDAPHVPELPWKFSIEDKDWYWPVKWLLYPLTDEVWVVKKISPNNDLAAESYEWVGIMLDGKLVFKTTEWNNEVVDIWSKRSVLALFSLKKEGRYSGVALEENWDWQEREEAKRWHRLLWVIRALLNDDRALRYGSITFRAHVNRYYQKWLNEFGSLFDRLASLDPQERKELLESLKKSLEEVGFLKGYFMYVYYP
jgi:hypothetical protein